MTRLNPDEVRVVAETLTRTQREVLGWLAWMPFLPVDVLVRLLGLRGPAEVYRSLARLEARDLVGRLQPPLAGGHNPRLAYLTGLGVAVVASELGMNPVALARARRLRRGDLLKRLARLPHDLALYRLLAAVAASGSYPPTVVGWQAPWRLSYPGAGSENRVTLRAPARVCLRCGEAEIAYLLIADLGGHSLRRYGRLLRGLVEWRHVQGGGLPLVVVGTVDEARAVAWRRLLVEAGRAQRDSPLEGQVVTWSQVGQGEVEIGGVRRPLMREDPLLVGSETEMAPADNEEKDSWNLRGVEPTLMIESLVAGNRLAVLSLTLTVVERELLDVVARHPFLSAVDVAEVMNWTTAWARRQCARLVELGVLRRLEADEVGARAAAGGWLEVTRVALRLLAEQRGLTLAGAARWLGYVGGGPQQAIGVRRKLVQVLAHTLGVNSVFVGLYREARQARAEGRDEQLRVWRNAALCGLGLIRPDGYGVYAVDGQSHRFWLEYDRGTMGRHALQAKFEAYAEYHERRLYRRHDASVPTLLVVTRDNAYEARIQDAIRAAGSGDDAGFTIRLTNEKFIHDPRSRQGIRGPIWRRPEGDPCERSRWP